MNTYKCLRALIIFLIIAGWIFSGWPRIWRNPPIPPEIQKAQAAAPVIDSSDITHTNNTVTTARTISYPAYGNGDLIIQAIATDANVSHTPPSSGPNGETLQTIIADQSPNTSGPHLSVIYYIATAAQSSPGTLTWGFSANETSSGETIVVSAGEFDPSTPIDAISSVGVQTSGTGATITMPSFDSVHAGGRVVAIGGIDSDPMDDPFSPMGWTDRAGLSGRDDGSQNTFVATRDAETTASETIAAADFGINTGDTAVCVGFIVNGLLNAAPAAPTLSNIPFDNEKTGDSTPDFKFTANDPDGSSDITYQIQIDDSYDFGSVVVNCESDTTCATGDGDFTRTGDSDPFTEAEEVTFTPVTEFSNNTTYYWRVRAKDVSGSGSYGEWSTTTSVTYISGTDPSEWFQTTDEQFDTGTLDGTQTSGSDSVEIGSSETEFVRADATAGSLSTSLDIGTAGTNRLVVVFASSEADSAIALTGVTVSTASCNFVVQAYNTDSLGNRTELWYCDESDLGSLNGTQTITISGSGLTGGNWAVHAQLFTGISQSGPADYGVDESSVSVQTVTVSGMDVSAGGIVAMGICNGTQGLTASWPSPLTEKSDADPSSSDGVTASGIETSAQTDKTYQADWSSAPNRSSGVAASWDAAPVSSGTITSPAIDFDWVPDMDDWNELKFTDTETSSDIKYDIEYWDGDSWEDTSIVNQDTSPVDISSLDPETHSQIRIVATLTDEGDSPYLNDWTVSWKTGAVGPTVSCSSNVSSTTFSAWSAGDTSIKTSSPNASTTMSCSGTSGGCTLYVKDAGSGSNPGLWRSTSPTKLVPSPNAAFSTTATLSAGTEGYGIQATSTAAGLTIAIRYLQTGNTVGGLTLGNQTLASSTADISKAEVIVIHKAAISETTFSGSYTDTITYECTVN